MDPTLTATFCFGTKKMVSSHYRAITLVGVHFFEMSLVLPDKCKIGSDSEKARLSSKIITKEHYDS